MTEQRRMEVNKLLKDTCCGLLNKFSLRRNIDIDEKGRQKKMYLQCCNCSRKRKKSIHHRNDMLIVPYRTLRSGKMCNYEKAYCSKCAEKYKSHKERVGGRD